jgi:hypothetical protein
MCKVIVARAGRPLQDIILRSDSDSSSEKFTAHLDTCAGINVIKDKRLFYKLHTVEPVEIVGVNSEGQSLISTMYGRTPFGYSYYAPTASLNLLSFGHLVDERFTITYRGVDQGADEFLVHNVHGIVPTDGTVRDVVFSRVVSNDNIYEATVELESSATTAVANSTRQLRRVIRSHSGTDTVAARQAEFSERELQGADRAIHLIRAYSFMSPGQLITLLAAGKLPNTDVTVQDVVRGNYIYGPDLGLLKGKAVARKPPIIEKQLSYDSIYIDRDLEMHCDLLFINHEPYFLSLFSPINYSHVDKLPSKSNKDIIEAVVRARATVQRYGPIVRKMRIDRESSTISPEVITALGDPRCRGGPLVIEPSGTTSVGDVERLVRTIT